jgi:hypothetical protein
LKTDARETTNVAGQHPDVIAQMESYTETARTDSPMRPVS